MDLTGKTRKGDNINALMDLMPEGTVMCMTIVVQAQDVLEERFTHRENAIGENVGNRPGCGKMRPLPSRFLGERHKLYHGSMTFLLTAPDLPLRQFQNQRELNAVLLNAGLQPTGANTRLRR